MPPTIILDIDGTILNHSGKLSGQFDENISVLPGVREKFDEWDKIGCRIILLTGRKESMRKITEKQLNCNNIYYDQLIMGVGSGKRILINDLKSDSNKPTAIAINVKRNEGITNIQL
jgi:hydroxymethylpyrimidine pyrophosphatase-like HAD family hydrolase